MRNIIKITAFGILFLLFANIIYELEAKEQHIFACRTRKECEHELVLINEEIDRLQKEKEWYQFRVARYGDQASRLQFNSETLSESRRYWALHDHAEHSMHRINDELSLLESQKVALEKRLK